MKASSRPSFIAVTGTKIGWNENSNNGKTGKIFYCSTLSHVTWDDWSLTSGVKWRHRGPRQYRVTRRGGRNVWWTWGKRQVWVGFVIILDIQLKPQRGVMAVKWDQMVRDWADGGGSWPTRASVPNIWTTPVWWVSYNNTICIQRCFNPLNRRHEGSKD